MGWAPQPHPILTVIPCNLTVLGWCCTLRTQKKSTTKVGVSFGTLRSPKLYLSWGCRFVWHPAETENSPPPGVTFPSDTLKQRRSPTWDAWFVWHPRDTKGKPHLDGPADLSNQFPVILHGFLLNFPSVPDRFLVGFWLASDQFRLGFVSNR